MGNAPMPAVLENIIQSLLCAFHENYCINEMRILIASNSEAPPNLILG